MDWSQKNVLITGGTGSIGKKMTQVLLTEYQPKKVIIFSRDELKQDEMRRSGFNDERLRYFIGDVRELDRLRRAMQEVDVVIHAAALKHVLACEYNPIEAVMTNVMGTRNIIDAALDNGVERVMGISTDKAVNPVNLYGATKLCQEKLMVHANAYSGHLPTRFSCARYGNVVGSSGSVIPLFLRQRDTGRITITDPQMTRFWITIDQGVRFVLRCVEQMHGGEVFVPKLPSMSILDVAEAVAPGCAIDEIGIRPGEKLHEVLINNDESRQTLDIGDAYVVQPTHSWWSTDSWIEGVPLPPGFRYASDTNTSWITVDDLKALIGDSVRT